MNLTRLTELEIEEAKQTKNDRFVELGWIASALGLKTQERVELESKAESDPLTFKLVGLIMRGNQYQIFKSERCKEAGASFRYSDLQRPK